MDHLEICVGDGAALGQFRASLSDQLESFCFYKVLHVAEEGGRAQAASQDTAGSIIEQEKTSGLFWAELPGNLGEGKTDASLLARVPMSSQPHTNPHQELVLWEETVVSFQLYHQRVCVGWGVGENQCTHLWCPTGPTMWDKKELEGHAEGLKASMTG